MEPDATRSRCDGEKRALPIVLLPVHQVRIVRTETGSEPKHVPNAPRDGMQHVKCFSRPKDIKNSYRWILDGELLRKLYTRVMAIRASAGRSKRKREELTNAIVPTTVNRFVEVDFYVEPDGRLVFYITYGDDARCSSNYFRVFADDLTVCTGVPWRVYDNRPLANPGWAKVRRAVCAWAVALAWQRVADTEALARAENAMAIAPEADAAKAVELASGLIAKYADAHSTAGKAVLAAAERVAGLAMAPGGAVAMGVGEHFEAAAAQQ